MTTDPIAAARALIEPLTGYTPAPWGAAIYGNCGFIDVPPSGYDGDFEPADARLIAAAPELREMVATLADAVAAGQAMCVTMIAEAAHRARAHGAPSLGGLYWDGVKNASRLIEESIRTLTPADAQAALDKLLAEARAEGWRAGREAAAEIVDGAAKYLMRDPDYPETMRMTAAEIRALPEPKEVNHG